MTRNVLDKVGSLFVGEDSLVEIPRLLEIELGNFRKVEKRSSDEFLVGRYVVGLLLVSEGLNRRDVVGTRSLVVAESHEPISLEVGDGVDGSVDRKLSVVGAETVAMRVGVREETGLEDRISRGLDTFDEVGRGEGDLLDLGAANKRNP